MAIASIEFGPLSFSPSIPLYGKTVYLNEDGKFSTVDSVGDVKLLSSGGLTVFPDITSFPVTGDETFLYIASDTGEAHRWSPTLNSYTLLVDQIDAGTY